MGATTSVKVRRHYRDLSVAEIEEVIRAVADILTKLLRQPLEQRNSLTLEKSDDR